MPIDREELVRDFGMAADVRNATVLVGAGLSIDAGLPNWADLLAPARREANIPRCISDMPLLAEYYSQEVLAGREKLTARITSDITAACAKATPSAGHTLLAALPLSEIWTTNYDDLIERAVELTGPYVVIADDEDVTGTRATPGKRIIKMHGGIVPGVPRGFSEPTLTRRDYERFPNAKPRIWSLLQSTYLTRRILFLGFSFDDPNVEVLLRLARSLDATRQHYTVMKVPTDPVGLRAHSLRVRDLEHSGVQVCEISEYKDIEPLLEELARRTRPPRIFVSGSHNDPATEARFEQHARAIGSRLAEIEALSLTSLAGKAAGLVSHSFARSLRLAGKDFAPERIRFLFKLDSKPKPRAATSPGYHEVVGTRIHTSHSDLGILRAQAYEEARAAIVLGGGPRTTVEIDEIRSAGLPLIPVAATGGAAQTAWSTMTLADSGLPVPVSSTTEAEHHWEALNDTDVNVVALAVQRLAAWGTYSA